jgi:hypothetical protein
MQRIIRVYSTILIFGACAWDVRADASVLTSGSPSFPLQVDNIQLVVHHRHFQKSDSSVVTLPISLYPDLRDNIDSIFNYPDAFRQHRKEISAGKKPDRTISYLTFKYMGQVKMRVVFSGNGYRSGKLMLDSEHYPFVVVLSRGFAARLAAMVPKKK